ncbi:MAG: ATP-binding protein [Fermentimonas sp.]|jgi:ATP-dependent DNA helicase RecG
MVDYSTSELIEMLNTQDECTWIEAKKGSSIDNSIMETVCSFSNEPGLGGGVLLLGVSEDKQSLFPSYSVFGIDNPDKLQKDLATQCADLFNIPVRPQIQTESVNGKNVLRVTINELAAEQKPLYFKKRGLPRGAFRRIGSTDQSCTEDDLRVFYNAPQTFYDATILNDTDWNDVDETAVDLYRKLREKVKPDAEELLYDDQELLLSLNCITRGSDPKLTLCGLLLFGTKAAQRRCMPMMRVDYIRVPGTQWVQDPDNRFHTIDMRGSLLQLSYRAIDAVNADLPRGFVLEDNQVQAQNVPGLPYKVLREAVVNALMHRSYRENSPIQIIRYDNRIEIINPGFSLKPEEMLGEPGSETRNQFIAAVFHETDLAETKGTGIRTMRKLMQRSHLAPPTFESNREANRFVTRLLLHHFLNEEDITWLNKFKEFNLSDNQQLVLIFVRETGAIDNQTYRQISGVDILRSSSDLRKMRDDNLLEAKGKGRSTYYIAGSNLLKVIDEKLVDSAPVPADSAPVPADSAPVPADSAPVPADSTPKVDVEIPTHIIDKIDRISKRGKPSEIVDIIIELCSLRPFKLVEISKLINRSPKYLLRKYIQPLMKKGELEYLYKEMDNHPEQAYCKKEVNSDR